MELMELRSKYFHGVLAHNYYGKLSREESRNQSLKDILYKYECIFKDGYILPYKDIKEKHGGIDRHRVCTCNGEDSVSICLHEKSPEKIDIDFRKKAELKIYEENAFRTFVSEGDSYSGPSAIVLNESIKNEYELIRKGMYLERQVKKPISLKYMDAISIFPNSNIAKYFETGEDLIRHGRYYENTFNEEFLYNLRELMKRFGYNVPIVSIVTGHEFINNDELVQAVKSKKI